MADEIKEEGQETPTPAKEQTSDTASTEEAVQSEEKTEAKTLLSEDEAKPNVPESYDLKLPEGSTLGDGIVDEIAEYAKAQGLSNEQAQAQLERENSLVAKYADGFQARQQEQFDEQVEAWGEETRKDPEIGGANLKKSIELSRRVLSRFGSDELQKSLDASGFGNRVEVIRFLSAIGKSMSDDSFVSGGKPVTSKEPKQPWQIMYEDSA